MNENNDYSGGKPASVLKKLNPRHKKAVQLHLQGTTLQKISDQTGLSPTWVCKILKSKAAKKQIAEYSDYFDQVFLAQYTKSIAAVRDGLQDPDINVRLKAADTYFKAHGKYKDATRGDGQTAEDLIQRIMKMMNDSKNID